MAQDYFCRLSENMMEGCCAICKKRMPNTTEALIRELRQHFGHTRESLNAFGARLGLTGNAVASWVSGEKFPHRRNLKQIMDVLTEREIGGHPDDCPLAKALRE